MSREVLTGGKSLLKFMEWMLRSCYNFLRLISFWKGSAKPPHPLISLVLHMHAFVTESER